MSRGSVILGTAGHVDHGKSALVRALTGQETDRLPAEQERGISIELGFAHYELDGTRFGVIDVPGHERFIRHMLAGAHGIDVALIVVAADDGVMPQTEEHFDIVHLLGVRQALFVITKADLAPDRVDAVRSDIEVLACGTRFETAPVLVASGVTGAGLDALRAEIARLIRALPPRESRGFFRLPIDRVFGLHGHGVIVTGTASTGVVRTGDSLAIRPGDQLVRARSIQIHGETVAEASVGHRVAVNLAGVAQEDVQRGQWLTDPRVDLLTDRFDAWLEARGGLRLPLQSFERARVHVASAERFGHVILLGDRKELGSREAAFAQIVLDEPVLVTAGDRFVLRTETATRTTGGGVVVHPLAHRHRVGEAGLEERLTSLRDGALPARLAAFLDLLHEFAAPTDLVTQALGEEEETLVARGSSADVIPLPGGKRPEAWTTRAKWERLGTLVAEALTHFHRTHPLEAGMELESLRSRLRAPLPPRLFAPVVARLESEGLVVRTGALVRLVEHRVELGAAASDLADLVVRALRSGGFSPPDRRRLEGELGVPGPRLTEVLRVLEQRGDAVRVAPDLYFDPAALDDVRRRTLALLEEKPEITVAELRDLLSASRKYALALLEYFDRKAITVRVGDARRLRR
jgi:selenocysteine-specific elongation factor